MRAHKLIIMSSIVLLGAAQAALAGHGCCAHCGCRCDCQKVCRLICEEKKVEVVCWGCKCEDFCIPGPSKPGCKHCDTLCETCDDGCDSSAVHAEPFHFVWREWIPGCAHVHTKAKLMKKTVTKKVPSFKWVVEDLCAHCDANCPCANIPPGTSVPAPPPLADGVKLKPIPAGPVAR